MRAINTSAKGVGHCARRGCSSRGASRGNEARAHYDGDMASEGLKLADGVGLDQLEDDVAVAFAWAAENAEAVEHVRREPDESLARDVCLGACCVSPWAFLHSHSSAPRN